MHLVRPIVKIDSVSIMQIHCVTLQKRITAKFLLYLLTNSSKDPSVDFFRRERNFFIAFALHSLKSS